MFKQSKIQKNRDTTAMTINRKKYTPYKNELRTAGTDILYNKYVRIHTDDTMLSISR